MTLELTAEQEAIVLRAAEACGKTPTELFLDAVSQFAWIDDLEDDPEEQRIIEERIAEADRNDSWISHEEVGRRLGLIPVVR